MKPITKYASSRNKHLSLNIVAVRPTRIMNGADNNWKQFYKIKYLMVRKSRKKIYCPGFFHKMNPGAILCTEKCPSIRFLEESMTP